MDFCFNEDARYGGRPLFLFSSSFASVVTISFPDRILVSPKSLRLRPHLRTRISLAPTKRNLQILR